MFVSNSCSLVVVYAQITPVRYLEAKTPVALVARTTMDQIP